jgi:hypothetical protein
MRTHGAFTQHAGALALALLLAQTLCACGPSSHEAAPAPPKFDCWDGSAVSDDKCPELTGTEALEWLVPQRQSGPAAICKTMLPTQYSPVATADDILACTWPDLKAELTVNRYPAIELAKGGCYTTEDWIV